MKSISAPNIRACAQNYRYYSDPIDGDFSPYDACAIFNNYGAGVGTR